MVRRHLAAVLVAAACLPAGAAAQGVPLRLTLDEAIARAEQNSQRLAELAARADAAAAAEQGRQAADRPMASALLGYTRTNHVDEYAVFQPGGPTSVLYPDVPDNYRARIDLQWPIYTAGRAAALERAAGAERDAARHDVAAARADSRLEATRAFWALVTARQTEAVLARTLASTDAHVRDLRVRLEQGLIPPNDLLSAEAERSHQRLLAIEAENLRGVAEADLRRVIGEDSGRPLEPAAMLDAPADPDIQAPHPAALAAESLTGRAERRALASRVAAARERESAIAAGAWPQIALAGGYDYARPNVRIFPRQDAWLDSWDVSVNVTWSLFDGGRRRAEQAEAAAGTRALAARAADFDRQLAFEVERRRLEVVSARAAIQAADDGLTAAVEARRVVGERYAAGVATSTDVLDADTTVLRAELERTRAMADARLALARLDRALGR